MKLVRGQPTYTLSNETVSYKLSPGDGLGPAGTNGSSGADGSSGLDGSSGIDGRLPSLKSHGVASSSASLTISSSFTHHIFKVNSSGNRTITLSDFAAAMPNITGLAVIASTGQTPTLAVTNGLFASDSKQNFTSMSNGKYRFTITWNNSTSYELWAGQYSTSTST